MPRSARKKSKTNIYHVMLRGINRQRIFEDREDNEKFLGILQEYKAVSGYRVFAYCLMGNHIHLLIQFQKEPIEQGMKRICSKFVYWYNTKYGRVGHLFQDRYKSEPIEDDSYLLSCFRYIHQNPVKAGIGQMGTYPYSSYTTYFGEDHSGLVDTEYILSMVSSKQLKEFLNQNEIRRFIDISETAVKRITDDDAKKIIQKISKCNTVSEFQALNQNDKIRYIEKFKAAGLGIRQISRLTGESYYFIQKI